MRYNSNIVTRYYLCGLFLILLISCKTRLSADHLITDIFENSEINDLSIILDYYDDLVKESISDSNSNTKFELYLKRVSNNFDSLGMILNHDYGSIKILIEERLKPRSFEQIWWEGVSTSRLENDSIKIISINPHGRYIKFLKALATHEPVFHAYYNELIDSGGLSMISTYQMFINYNEYNINNERTRLIYAIEYFTIIYNHGQEQVLQRRTHNTI